MTFTPSRIYIKLAPDAAKQLAERARQFNVDDPRVLAADLVRVALALPPLCPQCGIPTISHPDPLMRDIYYCSACRESVVYRSPIANTGAANVLPT